MTTSRHAIVVTIAVALLFVPLAGKAQPGKVPRIGLLETGSLDARAPLWEAFRQAMRELGYVEGQTVSFEVRSADGESERLAALATELVRLRVDAIVTSGSPAALAAHQATTTIPLVAAKWEPARARPGREPGPTGQEPHRDPDPVPRVASR